MNKETQEKLLKIVNDNYETIAGEFSETRKKRLWPELLKLAELVEDGANVLDVGCGNGRLRQAFTGKGIRYVGIDNSANLIKLAAEDQALMINQQEFLVGDILALDKACRFDFDFIFCIAVLNHIPGQNLQIKALEQMKAKLSRSGRIILTNWNLWNKPKFVKLIIESAFLRLIGQNKMDFGDVLFDWKKGIHSQRYYHAFTKCELKSLAKKTGLKIERLYKDEYNYYMILKKPD